MKEVVLYGAGIRGRKVATVLSEHGIEIAGFCDSTKTGEIAFDVCGKTRIKPIFPLVSVENDKYMIIITIDDHDQAIKVAEIIKKQKIELIEIEQVLYPKQDVINRNREYVATYHIDVMNDYFVEAERKERLEKFWGENSLFRRMFGELNIKRVVELACGRGRHVPFYIQYAQEILLVDILQKNIDYCKERFREESKIKYYINNGYDFGSMRAETYTALFTYDAMVHFEMMDIFQYLKETRRILIKGGRALFHHSNNTEDYRITFSTATHGRNYMSKDLFAYMANRAGLKVLEQQVFDWNGVVNLDCLTLVEKS
ncbi:methyltransferase domain-containing protein [Lachnospiraceae bacterium 48-21]